MTFGRVAVPADTNRELFLVALFSVIASIARTLTGGQDLNFDLVTYHYYLGYSAFFDRLAIDFLPAGAQGYQSPLPYALLYFLDILGTPPVVNATFHACIHALNLIVLYLLTKLLIGGTLIACNRVAAISFWLLGAVAPVYWKLVGTSFGDLVTSVPVLVGLWLVARSVPARDGPGSLGLKTFALGAALVGAAVGMRVHTVIYVVALASAILLLHFPNRREKSRAMVVFSLAAVGGWIACFGPWAWRVYREFGNPVFPLYNGVFGSPDFPSSNLPLTSFVPVGLADALTLPFRIGTFTEWVYVEGRLPDVRPGLLALCVLAYGGIWAYRRIGSRSFEDATLTQPQRLIMMFFFVGAILWLATSGNGRYGVALFLVGGPVCGVLLHRMLPLRYVLMAIGAAVLWQAALHQVFFKQYRWVSDPWTSRYFDWDIPAPLSREPAVYLSFGYQTASTLVPRVHPASRHVNLVGQYSPGLDDPGHQRIQQIIHTPGRRIYGVFDFYYTQQADPSAVSIKTYFRKHLRLWGLDFTDQPCTLVPLKPASSEWDWLNQLAGIGFRGRRPEFILCELRSSSARDRDQALLEYRNFQKKLAPLARACPRAFRKPLTFVRVEGQWWLTSFASFERRFDFDDEGKFYLQQLRPPYAALALGNVTQSAIVPRDVDCDNWLSRLAEISATAARQ